jgi:hypothetical protein
MNALMKVVLILRKLFYLAISALLVLFLVYLGVHGLEKYFYVYHLTSLASYLWVISGTRVANKKLLASLFIAIETSVLCVVVFRAFTHTDPAALSINTFEFWRAVMWPIAKIAILAVYTYKRSNGSERQWDFPRRLDSV